MIPLFVVSQEILIKKSEKIEVQGGKKYYIHIVEAGQTLYSIAKVYNVTISSIVFANPETIDGLKIESTLRIPLGAVNMSKNNAKIAEKEKEGDNFIYHTVQKKETLYSISKLYSISQDSMKLLNTELEFGMKTGQVLKIPMRSDVRGVQKTNKDTIIESPPEAIPVKPGELSNVAFLFPFYLNENEENEYNKTENETDRVPENAKNILDFYEGALIALDSLKKSGHNIRVHVFDTHNDTVVLKKILEKTELSRMDMIIGPLNSTNFEHVAKFAKEKKIFAVSPFLQNTKLVNENPYIFKVVPTTVAQVEQLASYIGETYSAKNIVVINNGTSEEKEFQKVFLDKIALSFPGLESKIKLINYKEEGAKGIDREFMLSVTNVVVVLSSNQSFVSSFFLKMNNKTETYNMILFGMPTWRDFENIDIDYFQNLQLHIVSPFFVNYEEPKVKDFVRNFRAKYKAEPDNFAFQGFDVTYFFLSSISTYGRDLLQKLPQIKKNSLQTCFHFNKSSSDNGFENSFAYILKYQDYKLVRVNK